MAVTCQARQIAYAAVGDIFRGLIQLGKGKGESSFALRFNDKQFNLLKLSSDLSSGVEDPALIAGRSLIPRSVSQLAESMLLVLIQSFHSQFSAVVPTLVQGDAKTQKR